MQRLSGTDSLFLAGETPSWHQHVAALSTVDPRGVPDFGFDAVVRSISRRLPTIPKLMWKLKEVPLRLDRPVWVCDEDFDIHRHVRRACVPAPGDARATAELVGRILGEQLDRHVPLWEIWYLDGLANGRIGLMMKYHHSLFDGVAGSGLATLLLDVDPGAADALPRLESPLPRDLTSDPSDTRLFVDSLGAALTAPWRLTQYGWRLTRRAADAVGYALSAKPKPDVSAMLQAPRTSFNHTIGPRRAMAFASVSLDDARRVKQRYEVSLNDVVLAVCSGALRAYLAARDELPERTLTAGVPVSIRGSGDASLDNQISYMVVPLATNVADPAARLVSVHRATRAAKELNASLRTHRLGSLGAALPQWALAPMMHLVDESHFLAYVPGMMNALVSNVTGPGFPLYIAGARLTGMFTASVILESMGVNVTACSFDDRIDFGIHVDPDLVPDPWRLAGALTESFAELMRAADLGPPTGVADAFGA